MEEFNFLKEKFPHCFSDKFGLDLNYRDDKKNTILNQLCKSEHLSNVKAIEYLINQKVNPNEEDVYKQNSIIHACANQNVNKEVIETLMKHKSDPTKTNLHNKSAIHFACYNKKTNLELIKLLYQNGGDGNLGIFGALQNEKIDFKIIEYLISKKVDMNLKNLSMKSAFLHACHNEKIGLDQLKYLVENTNSDLFMKDKNQLNCIYYIVQNKNCSVQQIEYLLERGVEYPTNTQPYSVLHNYTKNPKMNNQVLRFLLEKGNSPNEVNY